MMIMTHLEFARTVYKMRQIQKECFLPGGMTKGNVATAKRLEQQVDAQLTMMEAEASRLKKVTQLTLGEQEQA